MKSSGENRGSAAVLVYSGSTAQFFVSDPLHSISHSDESNGMSQRGYIASNAAAIFNFSTYGILYSRDDIKSVWNAVNGLSSLHLHFYALHT